ncbi:MAG: hypothetical protein RSC76_03695 [Oscillospiraceae bacterium]
MNSSLFYDNPKEAKIPGYQSAVDKPISIQGAQPVSMNAQEYHDTETPLYYQDEEEIKMTVGSCLQMLLVQLIPIVGVVMLVRWACSKDNNYVRRVFSRAFLVFYGILGTVGTLAYFATTIMLH